MIFIMQTCHHAIIPSCNHSIMQTCHHAIMPSCNHAIMDASLAYLALLYWTLQYKLIGCWTFSWLDIFDLGILELDIFVVSPLEHPEYYNRLTKLDKNAKKKLIFFSHGSRQGHWNMPYPYGKVNNQNWNFSILITDLDSSFKYKKISQWAFSFNSMFSPWKRPKTFKNGIFSNLPYFWEVFAIFHGENIKLKRSAHWDMFL